MNYYEIGVLFEIIWIVMVVSMTIPFVIIFTQVYLEHRRNKKIEHIHRFYLKEDKKIHLKDIREWDKYF